MDIKNLNLNIFLKKGNSFEVPDFINPKKTWKNILYILFIIFFAGMVYDYLIYNFVNREPLYVEVPGEEMYIERLKIGKIESIKTFFDGKVKKTSELKKTKLIDPAL